MLKYKLPFIVIVAPKKVYSGYSILGQKLLRVVLGDPLCTGHVILRMRNELSSLHNGINAIFANKMA